MGKSIRLGKIKMGGKSPFVLIAGPCVIEDKQLVLRTAMAIKKITSKPSARN
jgi:2-dehydro-3-deoxyphosphooctonate aldolase (KDO 8-P synthase)